MFSVRPKSFKCNITRLSSMKLYMIIIGGAQRTVGSPLPCPDIKKICRGIQKAVHPFSFKNFEHLLWSGWNHNLRPGCRRHLGRTFHTTLGALRLDAPELFRFRSPNNGNVGIKFLCPHSWCFGSYFDVSSVFWLFFQANSSIILIDPV